MKLSTILVILTSIIAKGTLCANQPQKPIKYVIFDLGGVVYGTDADKFNSIVGKSRFVWAGKWAIRTEPLKKVKAEIRDRMFEILNEITPRKTGQIVCHDDSGKYEIPQIMCDWMQGAPCNKLMEQIHDYLDENPDIFKNSSERDLYTAIIDAALTPETFVKTRFFYEEAQKVAEWCLENNLELYGLTNWNGEAFEGIKKQDPQFFSLFKGFVSSSEAKTMKPGPGIFKYAETEWKKKNTAFDLAQAVLIDDQQENVDGAKAVGAQGILVTKQDDGTPKLGKLYAQLTDICGLKKAKKEIKKEQIKDKDDKVEQTNNNEESEEADTESDDAKPTHSIYVRV